VNTPTPIRRGASVFDLPLGELGYVFAQGIGFCGAVYLTLALFGFVPASANVFGTGAKPAEREDEAAYDLPVAPEEDEADTRTVPDRVYIPAISVDAEIRVPDAVDVPTLDNLLSLGAVYYPGSGVIEGGNIFVFAHSTNWSVVRNEAYKTFNNLDDLQPGDSIFVTANGVEHEYIVETVRVAPDSEVLVSFGGAARRLTLSTCNTFGLKEERVVVEARVAEDI
jgi:LPXTG-site transpeptidase (sortase) family protein